LINKGKLIDNLSMGTIIQLLNIGLDLTLKNVLINKHVIQKVCERSDLITTTKKILTNFVTDDIIQYVIALYIRY
jgi:hypothetical protein